MNPKNISKIFRIAFLLSFFYFPPVVPRTWGEELTTVNEALHDIFPGADQTEKKIITLTDEQLKTLQRQTNAPVNPQYDRAILMYTLKKDNQLIGYALENTVQGKWGPIHFLLGVNPSGKIINTIVISYEEKRGRPIAKPRFLSQFVGKSIENPVRLKKDINGITGATISSRGITDGIRKLLAVFEGFHKL